jgi:hypothetical protein
MAVFTNSKPEKKTTNYFKSYQEKYGYFQLTSLAPTGTHKKETAM